MNSYMVPADLISTRFQLSDALVKQTAVVAGLACSLMNPAFNETQIKLLENAATSFEKLASFIRTHAKVLQLKTPSSIVVKS